MVVLVVVFVVGGFFPGDLGCVVVAVVFSTKRKKCDKIWRLYAQKCRLTHRTTKAGKEKIDTRAGIYNSREHIHNGTFSSHSRLSVSLERSLERLCRSQTTLKKKGGRCKATKAFFSFPYSGQRDVRIHKGKVGQQEIQASIYNVCVCVYIYVHKEKNAKGSSGTHNK